MLAGRAFTISLALTLVSAGCIGTAASDLEPADSGSGSSANDEAPSMNLTVDVIDWDATWLPTWKVEVTATLLVDLDGDAEAVGHRTIGGVANFSINGDWGGCGEQLIVTERKVVYERTTGPNGSIIFDVGPVEFDACQAPILYPACENTGIWAWGIAGWMDEPAVRDTDLDGGDICTQSYP